MDSPDYNYEDPNERNKRFIMNGAVQRFNQVINDDEVLFKDLKLQPDVKKYAKNLLECCRENTICREAISVFYFSSFVDGFNMAINCRIDRG